MDGFGKLPRDSQVVLGGAIASAIVAFFNWQKWTYGGFTLVQSEWTGIGIAAGFVGWLLLGWEISRVGGAQFTLGGPRKAATSLILALLLAALTVITFLVHADGRNWPAWLGLAISLVIAGAAWARGRREGVQFASPGA
jgi:hypothetical protein